MQVKSLLMHYLSMASEGIQATASFNVLTLPKLKEYEVSSITKAK